MRILLAGSPEFASDVFSVILQESGFEIVGLLSQKDKPFGRKAILKAPHAKDFMLQALQNKTQYKATFVSDFKIFQFDRLDSAAISEIRALKASVILVVAYGKLLPSEFLNLACCINIHASLLPKYRGASPLQQMILSNDKYFGVSAMKMGLELDSGDVLGFSYVKNVNQNLEQLSKELALKGGELALKVLKNLKFLEPLRQIGADKSVCRKIKKSDGLVEFNNATKLFKTFLAFTPWPGIFINSKNGYTLKLCEVKLLESSGKYTKGQIVDIVNGGLVIGCECGLVQVDLLQQEGKSVLKASIYAQGKRLKINDLLV